MAPTSFKRSLGLPPSQYRTPSPPSFAFEPLSPIITATEDLIYRPSESSLQNGIKRPSHAQLHCAEDFQQKTPDFRGTMETFASIALATGRSSAGEEDPLLTYPRFESVQIEDSQDTERPSKRARSEKPQPPNWARPKAATDTRPVTSYEQSSDSRTFEAELLLNLSHEARFSNTWVVNGQQNNYLVFEKRENLLQTSNDPSCYFPGSIDSYGQPQETSIAITDKALPTGEKVINGNERKSMADSSIVNQQDAPVGIESLTSASEINKGENPDEALLLPDQTSNGTQERTDLMCLSNNDVIDHTQVEEHPAIPTPIEPDTGALRSPDINHFTTENAPTEPISKDSQVQLSIDEDGTSPNDPRSISRSREDLKQSNTDDSGYTAQVHNEAVPKLPDFYDQITTGPALPPVAFATCSACHFTRNSSHFESEINSTSWISCDGCKSWFHFACAGFKSGREVRSVDKYRCRNCKHVHGSTTYVRKSSRAHSAIDYAGLNEGVLKTSDERPEHHYIKPIKEGIITFLPENFARMRPELVTAEYFEKGNGMKEPVVIPAHLNPQPTVPTGEKLMNVHQEGLCSTLSLQDNNRTDEWLPSDTEFQSVPDQGQDALDMVMPKNLTVRMVADLYGPEEKVEVIDVKSQNGEGKKWNMRRWADYYESSNEKAVRNVISLEVSYSKLGRLIRRPQIVRDLDLQDSVWPQELLARGESPRVQLYCLMSVADCFTDFHIDFGGSSVFYHILKGKKTFLFIPPKEKHLKKYEEWCMSPAQNWTFLADQTKECYRVDLKEGDTMLIPAGWIHAVWTPEDSLVIGGNFLTRMHYAMQIRIAQIEKATGVARKFRYPSFQKLQWYTALRYMEDDPLPESLKTIFWEGGKFHREQPAHYSFDAWGENSISGLENYHARYYAQSELEGLPDLIRYLLRTALIDLGSITEGITTETRNAVKRAIPRGYGEPLDLIKDFAMWCAWKRGNEPIPHWAYPHVIPESGASDSIGKLSTNALKKLDQEAALQAPRRQSTRRRSHQLPSTVTISGLPEGSNGTSDGSNQRTGASTHIANIPTPSAPTTPAGEKSVDIATHGLIDASPLSTSKFSRKPFKTGTMSHRKPACDSCRKRRRACKHREQGAVVTLDHHISETTGDDTAGVSGSKGETLPATANLRLEDVQAQDTNEVCVSTEGNQEVVPNSSHESLSSRSLEALSGRSDFDNNRESILPSVQNPPPLVQTGDTISSDRPNGSLSRQTAYSPDSKTPGFPPKDFDSSPGNSLHIKGRTKACNDCRRSKRRCIHDEHGKEDPAKAREAAIPKVTATLKRRKPENEGQTQHSSKKPKPETKVESLNMTHSQPASPQSADQLDGTKQTSTAMAVVAQQREASDDHHLETKTSESVILQSPADKMVHMSSQSRNDEEMESLDFNKNNPTTAPEMKVFNRNVEASLEDVEDEVQLVVATPHPKTDQKGVKSSEVPGLERTESLEQPAASSLVSPPASSHDDAEESPPSSHTAVTPCASSSRHSSRHSKQVQRYTPESGPARRASSSSAGDAVVRKITPAPANPLTADPETGTNPSQRITKASTGLDIVADEESLKLIKELQAQEHGLRRRGRAS